MAVGSRVRLHLAGAVLGFSAALLCGPPVAFAAAANLVAAYSYDEGTGTTVVDGSLSNNPGTVSNATWSTACKAGKCLSFNGTSSFVESPDINALTPGINATFEAWVFLPTVPTDVASVFNKWNQTADDEFLVGITPSRTLMFAWHTTGGNTWPSASFNQAFSTGKIRLNTWTHIAVVRSGAFVTFYINGIVNTSLAVMDAKPFRNGANTLRVGGQGRGAERFFNGSIDDVRMYNRALTTAEIAADMNPATGPDLTPPVLSAISASGLTQVAATITWTTNEASDTQVGYGLTPAYGNTSPLVATLSTQHVTVLTGLLPNTVYHYQVRSRDGAGNLASSGDFTFTTILASNGLVAAYSYDEGAGAAAADASASNNTGAVSGAAWSTACRIGKCLSFNGAGSFVESPDINALTPGADATFEAWVFLASAPTEIVSIFNKWNQTIDDEYVVGISPGRMLYFAWHTTGGNTWPSAAFNQANSTGTIPLNTWTHIAVVRSGARLTFHINGVANTSLVVMDANPFRNGAATLRVGAQGRGMNRFFNGTIDEVRMYNRALTPSEIAADMGPGPVPDVTPPVISLTAPVPNTTVSRLVTVSANATDNVSVAGVQFKLDGVNLGLEDALAPFSVLWDTTTASPGFHTLSAVAFDAAGNQSSSTPVAVTVSNNSQVTLAWDANVEPALAGYRLYLGDVSGVYGTTIDVGNVTSVTVTTLQAGHLYFFAVSAYDQNGVESGFSNEVTATAP